MNILSKMIVAIRIKGRVEVPKEIKDTLYLLRLRHKFVCSLYHENKQILGMLKKVEHYVAYGKINVKALEELIKKRGRKIGDKKLNESEAEEIIKKLKQGIDLKKLSEKHQLKPFFRLAPPRKGFKKSTKLLWPQGVLGNIGNKINDLLLAMI